ncbi:MAG TPA: Rrf2 family transcriptional regulator [Phycisphaerales bacterium]|nr:Rrf2 family transcriptional regulator [Phycisphaerales bacterium]
MFSQTAEYALRAMNYLASNPDESAASEVIAARTKVSPGYLSKVMRDLVVAGLVISQRGPNGGFVLAKSPASVTILDIVDAVDPIRRIEKCPLGNPEHVQLCPLHSRLDDAIAQIRRTLGGTSLADLLGENRAGRNKCDVLVGGKPVKSRPKQPPNPESSRRAT